MADNTVFQPQTNITYKYFVEIVVGSKPVGYARFISFGSERNANMWRMFLTASTDNPLRIQEVYPGLQSYTGTLRHVTAFDDASIGTPNSTGHFSFLREIGAVNYNPNTTDDNKDTNYGLDILFQTKPVDLVIHIYSAANANPIKTVTLAGCWFGSSSYSFDMASSDPIVLQEVAIKFKTVTVS